MLYFINAVNSDQDAVAVVHFMLDDLGLETVQYTDMRLHLHILPLKSNRTEAFDLPYAFKGQTAFLCFKGTGG